jgi:hypothetical protein
MLNGCPIAPAVAVAVGEEDPMMVLVGTVVAVVVGVTSGKIPFPHPESGINRKANATNNINPGRKRAMFRRNR